MHPNNPHRGGYNFDLLCAAVPELKPCVYQAASGRESIDFSNPLAVKLLNQALLKTEYGIEHWDIPEGYLCPPIPGRADYIHALAELLAKDNGGEVPQGRYVKGLDIGSGANCIYPILGVCSYDWRFVGSDIDPVSVNTAKYLVKFNPQLKGKVDIRQQSNPNQIFKGIIKENESFAFTLCNPPFHASAKEANQANLRKLRNLTGKSQDKTELNFAGQNNELWCEGGEIAFIKRMVKESVTYGQNCQWFSCLVSKKENLKPIYRSLQNARAKKVATIEMAQGQKISRFIAWTFLTAKQRQDWFRENS